MPDETGREDELRAALNEFQARHAGTPAPTGFRAGPPARVRRLDRGGAYLLIPILDAGGLRGIVQIDEESGTIESSASIRDPASGFLEAEEAALSAAQRVLPGRHGWGKPFLGWRPCRESFSSLRPFWVIPHAEGEAFVAQSGEVFETLTSGRGG